MGYFRVDKKVFEKLPDYCLGVIVAKGIINSRRNEKIVALMQEILL